MTLSWNMIEMSRRTSSSKCSWLRTMSSKCLPRISPSSWKAPKRLSESSTTKRVPASWSESGSSSPWLRRHAAWGRGRIADAHGIFVSGDDRVFLVDRDAHQILIFTTMGEPLGEIGERHEANFQAPFNHPTDVALAADGEIYVSDGYGNSVVHRFSPEGEHIATWGRPGAGEGEFTTPHAVWVDSRDRVLVADRENDRVQLFDRDGGFLEAWGDFYHPMDISEDDQGRILVTDQIPRLSMLDGDGTLVGRSRAVWNGAHGIACNAKGDIFLAEIRPNRITKLSVVD